MSIPQDFNSDSNSNTFENELLIANKALAIQIENSEKRAAELVVANEELAFQNKEKEDRAAELIIANKELAFQNEEKENRAAELVIANLELAFQIEEKAKRANELLIANKELESFNFISSHDLQEPLRKIQAFSDRILTEEKHVLSAKGKHYFERIQHAALHMQTLINDLLAYSRTNNTKRIFEKYSLKKIVHEVLLGLQEELQVKHATVEIVNECSITVIPFQFKQLLHNLITNSLKYCKSSEAPHITIDSTFISKEDAIYRKLPLEVDYTKITFSDNGIGFESIYSNRIFEIFQRLHDKKQYDGTGIGLTIVRKIVENHNGIIVANGNPGIGATFEIYLPQLQNIK